MVSEETIVDTICIFINAEVSRVVQDFNVNTPPKTMRIWIVGDHVEIIAFLCVLLIAGDLR